MSDSSKSQSGGVANIRGLDYQKKFIAYLCTEIVSGKRDIKRITCEYKDDIEVEEDSKLVYYQIKSTTDHSLRKEKIMESIKLFSDTYKSNSGRSAHNEFVLVSNARIMNFEDLL